MTDNLVSIITPSFNSEMYISQSIQSVLQQTYKNWEMIIIDDHSKDNTLNIIERFVKQDSRIKLIKLEKNCGAAIARNSGISIAKGKYIAFLDSDDLWEPQKLQCQINYMKSKGIGFSFSQYWMQKEDSNDKKLVLTRYKVNYNNLLKTCDIGCLTAIYDQEKLGKVFMPDILKRQDYGLWLSLLKKTEFAYSIQEPLAIYRLRTNSISNNKFKTMYYIWKVYRDVEKINIIKSVYYMVHYIYFGIRRYT